ncbi:MAG: flippase-like domain-containing protein [Candidatus Altarchaeum sp.]|nr:flippase-like domain-containing protein [Candidatus Altarchaeum sp.]
MFPFHLLYNHPAKPPNINKKTIALFAMSIILLIILLSMIGIDKVWNAMSKLDVRIFLFLIGLQVFIIFLHTLRWAIVLYNKIKNKEISFTSLFMATSVALFSGNIVPVGSVVSEPIRAYILSKLDNFPMAKSFGSAIINLNLEILPVLLFISIAIYFVLADEISVYIVLLLIIAAIFVGILSLISFLSIVDRKRALNIATFFINLFSKFSFLKKRMSETKIKIGCIISEFHDGAKYGLNLKIFGLGTIISFIIWFFSFLRPYIVFIAIGYNIDIAVFVAVLVVVLIISYIPTLPGGIGIWEISSIGLYTLLGVPSEYAAAAIIVDRLISYWFVCLFGYAALIIAYKRINNKNINITIRS